MGIILKRSLELLCIVLIVILDSGDGQVLSITSSTDLADATERLIKTVEVQLEADEGHQDFSSHQIELRGADRS